MKEKEHIKKVEEKYKAERDLQQADQMTRKAKHDSILEDKKRQ
jgi:hypothetical protein